jgi:hypothetical protein
VPTRHASTIVLLATPEIVGAFNVCAKEHNR